MEITIVLRKIKQFVNRPSKFPAITTLITSTFTAFVTYWRQDSKFLDIPLIGGLFLYFGLELRNSIYNKPYQTSSSNKEFLAEEDGELSAQSYIEYLTSFFNPDAYRHPIIFGRAMFAKMNEKENKESVEEELERKVKLKKA